MQDIPVQASTGSISNGVQKLSVNEISNATGYAKGKHYPYERLTSSEVPEDVDPSKKEEYLSVAEFEKLFGMDQECFAAIPPWKQVQMKKKAGLF